MNAYSVFHIGDEVVLFINSTEDLYFIQSMIYEDLSQELGERFSVLVDLFLRNGFSFNRFVVLSFIGKDKITSHIVNPRDVAEDVKRYIRLYLKTNLELLEESSLPQKVINFIQIA